jgi:hypothetical protein
LNQAQTKIRRQTGEIRSLLGFRTAFSLHSHTQHSKENLAFLPLYIDYHTIPIVGPLFHKEMKKYRDSHPGKAIDFSKAYWTPPMSPAMVLESETRQIEEKLGLRAFVSITDHDTIAGPLGLQPKAGGKLIPISVEWSIPFRGNCFHLGVHHLDPARANELMDELARYTAEPQEDRLCDLLASLHSCHDTLIILNHPCCNFVKVGATQHWATLQQFLELCRPRIHAVEINGMRPWNENQKVLSLAAEWDLPVISGGDRHGCRPNTMLNLTQAETWGEFVEDVRNSRPLDVLILPAYEEPVRFRELATAGDVLRRYPDFPFGRRRFTDRIWADVDGYSWHPLSFYLDGGRGTPLWLLPIVGTVLFLSHDRVRPILRGLFSSRGEYDRHTSQLRPDFASLATSLNGD